MYDVCTDGGRGVNKCSKFADKPRTERGGGAKKTKTLWMSYMEAPIDRPTFLFPLGVPRKLLSVVVVRPFCCEKWRGVTRPSIPNFGELAPSSEF